MAVALGARLLCRRRAQEARPDFAVGEDRRRARLPHCWRPDGREERCLVRHLIMAGCSRETGRAGTKFACEAPPVNQPKEYLNASILEGIFETRSGFMSDRAACRLLNVRAHRVPANQQGDGPPPAATTD